jgi:transposase-like protein
MPAKPGRRRYTEEDAAEWYRMRAEEHLSDYQISQRVGACFETVQRWLADYQPPAEPAESEPEPEPVAEQAEPEDTEPESDGTMNEMVDRWAAALHRGLTVAKIAANFHTNERAVSAALKEHGLVCACGAVVGQENPGVLKGHNGTCGYCLQDKLGVKAASGII